MRCLRQRLRAYAQQRAICDTRHARAAAATARYARCYLFAIRRLLFFDGALMRRYSALLHSALSPFKICAALAPMLFMITQRVCAYAYADYFSMLPSIFFCRVRLRRLYAIFFASAFSLPSLV